MGHPTYLAASRDEFLAGLDANGVQDTITCTICLEDTTSCKDVLEGSINAERAVVVHGSHNFGERCIRQWLATNDSCPSCRKELFPPGEQPFSIVADDGQTITIAPRAFGEEPIAPSPQTAETQAEIRILIRNFDEYHRLWDDHLRTRALADRKAASDDFGFRDLVDMISADILVCATLTKLNIRQFTSNLMLLDEQTFMRRPSIPMRVCGFLASKLKPW